MTDVKTARDVLEEAVFCVIDEWITHSQQPVQGNMRLLRQNMREEVAALAAADAVAGAGRDADAVRDVAMERARQIAGEGWTTKGDDAYRSGELAKAASSYARHAAAYAAFSPPLPIAAYRNATPVLGWPWTARWWKPSTPRRDLVKAGALIVAEIERLDRAAAIDAALAPAAGEVRT